MDPPERSSVPKPIKYIVAVLGFFTVFLAIFCFFRCLFLCFDFISKKIRKPVPIPESAPEVLIYAEEEVEEEHDFGPEIEDNPNYPIIYMSEEELRQMYIDEYFQLR